jgi:branched-chain amino acid transport system substrate-binding protein
LKHSSLFTRAGLALGGVAIAGAAHAQVSDQVIRIGLLTDMSGVYADVDGPGGVDAVKMAIADMGGSINGVRVEFLSADHLNKADVASAKAREWFDQQGLDMLIGGTNSATNLAMAKVAQEKKKPFFSTGGTTTRMTNEECTPYTIAYTIDTASLARGTASAIVKQGGKEWYFLSADYVYGASLEKDASDVVKASGGKVLGATKFPLAAMDFSSYMLQAQASRAGILGLATAGGDTVNAIKAANEFGVTQSMKLAGLLMFENDIHALGLPLTQGMYLTAGWYWDLDAKAREWSDRYIARTKRTPSMLHAAGYSAATTYLKAVAAIGTDGGDKVMAQLKQMPIDDFYSRNGHIRPDGRMVHDLYLMQVKSPAESKYPWDYYRLLQTIPGDQAFMTKAETKCELWK